MLLPCLFHMHVAVAGKGVKLLAGVAGIDGISMAMICQGLTCASWI